MGSAFKITSLADVSGIETQMRTIESEIALMYFRFSSQTTLNGPQQMIGGVTDEYENTSGLASYSGATYYSGSGGYLTNRVPEGTSTVMFDSYDTSANGDTQFYLYSGGYTKFGQAFHVGTQAMALKTLMWNAAANGAPTGTVTYSVYSVTGNSGSYTPNTVISSTTQNATSYSSAAWGINNRANVTLTFPSDVILQANTPYIATCEYSGGNGSNLIKAMLDTSSPTHAGNACTYSGTAWTATANDFPFEIVGTPYYGTVNQANLNSNATNAVGTPTKVNINILYADWGTNTAIPNTDLTAQVVANSTTATLTLSSSTINVGQGYKIMQGSGNVPSGLSTPISLGYNINLSNNKPINIHATTLTWK